MDPLWYVLYKVLVFTAVHRVMQGTECLLPMSKVVLQIISAVDDTIVLSHSIINMQRDAKRFLSRVKRLNSKVNSDRYGMVRIANSNGRAITRGGGGHVIMDGERINSVPAHTYLKILGGNVHVVLLVLPRPGLAGDLPILAHTSL